MVVDMDLSATPNLGSLRVVFGRRSSLNKMRGGCCCGEPDVAGWLLAFVMLSLPKYCNLVVCTDLVWRVVAVARTSYPPRVGRLRGVLALTE